MNTDQRVRDNERMVAEVVEQSLRRGQAWSALVRDGARKARARGIWCEFRLLDLYAPRDDRCMHRVGRRARTSREHLPELHSD